MENSIIFFIFSALVFLLIYVVIKFAVRNKKLFAKYIQSELDKNLISLELSRIIEENSVRELSESEGFVKFISTSRDWAFEYIEEVQKALAEFDEEVSPKFKSAKDSHKVLKEISLAYDKLKTVLPKETETPNN